MRKAYIRRSGNYPCWQGCGEKKPLFTVGGECISGSASMEHSIEMLQKS